MVDVILTALSPADIPMSPAKAPEERSSRASLLRILGVVVPIVIIGFLVIKQSNFLAGRALLIGFGNTETIYKNAWFEWDGDVVARDVVIYPLDVADEEFAIRAERLHVTTPGWWWFIRNTFNRKQLLAHMDRLQFRLEGLRDETGIDPTLGDLGPFSAASASPFEAEGCAQHGMWLREELVDMGLTPGETTLSFDYRVDGSQLHTTIVLHTPGVSKATFERESLLPTKLNALVIDQYEKWTQRERWEVADEGFVRARNAFCAKQDGVEPRVFVARHVESVERLMEIDGVAPDGSARDTYRRFARDGGTLVVEMRFPSPEAMSMLSEDATLGDELALVDARIEHNGRGLPTRFLRTEPRSLDKLDDLGSVWAAIEFERRRDPEDGSPPPAPAATTPVAAAGAPAATAEPAAETTDSAAPFAASTGAAPPAAAPPAAAPPPAATPVASATPAANSTPVAATQIGGPRPPQLTWNELRPLQGRLIRVWTRQSVPKIVEVLSIDEERLRVRVQVGGGIGEHSISRSNFLRAQLVR